jgi:hypothetical protein
VGRAVPPPGREAQRERSVRSLLDPLVRERRPGGVAAEPLEASPIVRGDAHIRVEAHAAVLGYARRCRRADFVRAFVRRIRPIAEASPRPAALRAGGEAGPQRCGGEEGESAEPKRWIHGVYPASRKSRVEQTSGSMIA